MPFCSILRYFKSFCTGTKCVQRSIFSLLSVVGDIKWRIQGGWVHGYVIEGVKGGGGGAVQLNYFRLYTRDFLHRCICNVQCFNKRDFTIEKQSPI